jgi:hypothetical protein
MAQIWRFDTQHNDTQHNNMKNMTQGINDTWHIATRHYAECRHTGFLIVMLIVVMLSVVAHF